MIRKPARRRDPSGDGPSREGEDPIGHRPTRSTLSLGVLSLLLWSAAAPRVLPAQEASLEGRITDASTGAPVAGADVHVVGTDLSTVSGENGRYGLEQVPTGTQTVRIRRFGYRPAVRSIRVAPAATTRLDVALSPSPLALDEMVVTATGEQRRYELGHLVERIAGREGRSPAVPDLSDLLTARAPGVHVLDNTGTAGLESAVRIRGSNSMSLSKEPIVFVDGVRINSRKGNFFIIFVGGHRASRIDDIDLQDVESVEIVKGPAAAALYGTEAANGVIHVRTRRGRAGKPRWRAHVEGGLLADPGGYPANYQAVDTNGSPCPLFRMAAGACTQDDVRSYNVLEDPAATPIRGGGRQEAGLSVSGGGDLFGYYLSGGIERERGVLGVPEELRVSGEGEGLPDGLDPDYRPNRLDRVSGRANLQLRPDPRLEFATSLAFWGSDLSLPMNDTHPFGVLPSALLGAPTPDSNGGWGRLRPEESYLGNQLHRNDRMLAALRGRWRPTEGLSLRAGYGVDRSNRNSIESWRRDSAIPGGYRESDRIEITSQTVDLSGSLDLDLSPDVTSVTTGGLQYFRHFIEGTIAVGTGLVPGSESISAASESESSEFASATRSLGLFLEERIGFRQRLFLTAGVRADDNSTFGSSLDPVLYPRLGASWIVSAENWFPGGGPVDELRVRAAWGASGLEPGGAPPIPSFDPVPTRIGGDEVIGVLRGDVGNPELRPERVTEVEGGLDAELLGRRLAVSLTAYSKQSSDALVNLPLPPSVGVGARFRADNIGSVRNRGLEASLEGSVVERSGLEWRVRVSGSANENRLLELAPGVEPILLFGGPRHQPGFPLGGFWERPLEDFGDADGDGLIDLEEISVGDTAVFMGTPIPPRQLSVSSRVRLGERVRLGALLDHRGGHVHANHTEWLRCRNARVCRGLHDPDASLFEQARAVAAAEHPSATSAGFMESAAFWRLREVSVEYTVPRELVGRLGLSDASLILAGRNLVTWSGYSGIDPEIAWPAGGDFPAVERFTMPPPRLWTARIAVSF